MRFEQADMCAESPLAYMADSSDANVRRSSALLQLRP